MVREGLTEKVETDHAIKIKFTNVGKLPPPVLQFSDVTFGYSANAVLYSHVDLGVDLDSRVAIVGANGTGAWAPGLAGGAAWLARARRSMSSPSRTM